MGGGGAGGGTARGQRRQSLHVVKHLNIIDLAFSHTFLIDLPRSPLRLGFCFDEFARRISKYILGESNSRFR